MDSAEKQGVHVMYTAGYGRLRREMESIARDDPYMPEEVRSEIGRVIYGLDSEEAERSHVERYHDAVAARLKGRREILDSGWSWDKRAFADREDYGAWRRDTEMAVEAAERLLVDRERYGAHLDGLANHPVKSLRSTAAGAREVLADDDRQMAEVLVPERKGDDPRRREERIAGLLDDPEKLRKLHRRQIERREARKAAWHRCKGRYQVRSMSMQGAS